MLPITPLFNLISAVLLLIISRNNIKRLKNKVDDDVDFDNSKFIDNNKVISNMALFEIVFLIGISLFDTFFKSTKVNVYGMIIFFIVYYFVQTIIPNVLAYLSIQDWQACKKNAGHKWQKYCFFWNNLLTFVLGAVVTLMITEINSPHFDKIKSMSEMVIDLNSKYGSMYTIATLFLIYGALIGLVNEIVNTAFAVVFNNVVKSLDNEENWQFKGVSTLAINLRKVNLRLGYSFSDEKIKEYEDNQQKAYERKMAKKAKK